MTKNTRTPIDTQNLWKEDLEPVKSEKKVENKGPFWIRDNDNAIVYGEKPNPKVKKKGDFDI